MAKITPSGRMPDGIRPASAARAARFERLCRKIVSEAFVQGTAGIGSLGEKRGHAVIKRFLCEDPACHEVPIGKTRYVADVLIGKDAYEVQTGAFYPMKKKIAYYLSETDLDVTIVHPVVVNKTVQKISPSDGTVSEPKRSPKHEGALSFFPELFSLLPHLGNPRLHFLLLFIEAEEFRLETEKTRHGTVCYERIPTKLLGEYVLTDAKDFARFLPASLPDHFTAREFSRHTKLRGRDAYSALYAMEAFGLFLRAETRGRAMVFYRAGTEPPKPDANDDDKPIPLRLREQKRPKAGSKPIGKMEELKRKEMKSDE